ncbi:ABC transporter ATP-binding protein, partial [Nocardia niigatensis]
QAMFDSGHHAGGAEEIEGIIPQMRAQPGMPVRGAVHRRRERVRQIMHTLPPSAQEAILADIDQVSDPETVMLEGAGYAQ